MCLAALVRTRKRFRGIQKKQIPPLGESRERLSVLGNLPDRKVWAPGSGKAELPLVEQ